MARIFGSSEPVPPENSPWQIDLERQTYASGYTTSVGTGPRSMKVACLSDTHSMYRGFERDLGDADLVILAGDMLDVRQWSSSNLRELDMWMGELPQPRERIIYVAGNHDAALCRAGSTAKKRRAALTNATYLEGDVVRVGDDQSVVVAGGPWVMARPFYKLSQQFALSGRELQDKWSMLVRTVLDAEQKGGARAAPDGSHVDILVTHGPPEGVFDIDYKDRRTGTVVLRDTALVQLRPRVHVFGHNHDCSGLVWGTLHRKACERLEGSPPAVEDESSHRMLFVCAAAALSRRVHRFTFNY